MPVLSVQGGDVNLPRNSALLDTNVLVALFDENDSLHGEARLTLEDDERFEWIVTGPVIVESCGMLMKNAGLPEVLQMLAWLVTPGNNVYVLTCAEGPNEHESRILGQSTIMRDRKIDFVDAYLMRTASYIAKAWNAPWMPIVTSDGRDFYNARGLGFRYGLIDLREPGSAVIPLS